MNKFLRSLGITGSVAYLAGMLSTGAGIPAWTASRRTETHPHGNEVQAGGEQNSNGPCDGAAWPHC
jgi:hypothetical protein